MTFFSSFLEHGLLGDVPYSKLIYTLCMVQLTILSVTIYLHRFAAHRALILHPIMQHLFRFQVWFTTGMITRQWVAIHRKHHAKCESVDDPHSPVQKGLLNILFKGVMYYKEEAKNVAVYKHAMDYPKDWIETHLYTPHNWLGITLLLPINIVLFGYFGFLIWLIQIYWIPFWAAGVINGVGHWFSPKLGGILILYQNWKDGDLVPEEDRVAPDERFNNVRSSANILPFAFWIGGEELHANHHAYPTSPKFSRKWFEFDVGWAVICILRVCGLAKLKANFR